MVIRRKKKSENKCEERDNPPTSVYGDGNCVVSRRVRIQE